ncbi:MAG: aminotransferase class III-fold pyridoxal phosphate-dependent enzyme [Flavobacteriaceae bacterium]
MELFNVYPLYDIVPESADGLYIKDTQGVSYLDLYGGHAVISIGHSHPHYVKLLKEQLDKIGFYSNSVVNPLQEKLALKLQSLSGCGDYNLFLCSTGAEANENALKLASFATAKTKVIAFRNSFHGRTSAAVAVTDNASIQAPINKLQPVEFLDLNDTQGFLKATEDKEVCAVILEAVQGVGGLDQPTKDFYKLVSGKCREKNIILIADEVQCGFGRTGRFFGFQHHGIAPDLITMAKGMGNGFPVGGVLIHKRFESRYGMLGTTFGGNHLACTAAISVLDVIEQQDLMKNAIEMEKVFRQMATEVPQVKQVKGRGLMLGLEFDFEVAELRKNLIYQYRIFTGSSKNKNVLRVLPALTIGKKEIEQFFNALKAELI